MVVNVMSSDQCVGIEVVFIGKYLQLGEGVCKFFEVLLECYCFLGEQFNEEVLCYLVLVDVYVLVSFSELQLLIIWEFFELDVLVCFFDLEIYCYIGFKYGVNVLMYLVGNIDLLCFNLQMVLYNEDVCCCVMCVGKSLLLKNFMWEWLDEFECLILCIQIMVEIRKMGY